MIRYSPQCELRYVMSSRRQKNPNSFDWGGILRDRFSPGNTPEWIQPGYCRRLNNKMLKDWLSFCIYNFHCYGSFIMCNLFLYSYLLVEKVGYIVKTCLMCLMFCDTRYVYLRYILLAFFSDQLLHQSNTLLRIQWITSVDINKSPRKFY